MVMEEGRENYLLIGELVSSADAMFDVADFMAAERAYRAVPGMIETLNVDCRDLEMHCLSRQGECASRLGKYAAAASAYRRLLALQVTTAGISWSIIATCSKLVDSLRLSARISSKIMVTATVTVCIMLVCAVAFLTWGRSTTATEHPVTKKKSHPAMAKNATATKSKTRKQKAEH